MTGHSVKVNSLAEYVGRFTDWSHNVVSFYRTFGSEVLNLVISLIKGRADEVGHTGIDNGKLLVGSLLDIAYFRDE